MIQGLRAAQVRAIFKLPPVFGVDEPLAYVNWFTPFREPQANTGMFAISRSTNTHVRNASVIPVSQIVRSCHLMPVFGRSKAVDLGWAPETVLEDQDCKTYFLNPYLRHHDFYYTRHLYNLHIARLEKEAREEAERVAAATRARAGDRPTSNRPKKKRKRS